MNRSSRMNDLRNILERNDLDTYRFTAKERKILASPAVITALEECSMDDLLDIAHQTLKDGLIYALEEQLHLNLK